MDYYHNFSRCQKIIIIRAEIRLKWLECLPSKSEALHSIPNTTNKNKFSTLTYSYSSLGKCHFMADPYIQTVENEKQ
jgi:hypothetical protein